MKGFMTLAFAGIAQFMFAFGPSRAAIPVNDQAILNQKAETAKKKTAIKMIVEDQSKARKGVKCAVTKPKKGETKDPRKEGSPEQGKATIEKFSPGAKPPSATSGGSASGNAAEIMTWDEAGAVVGGQQAAEPTIGANKETLSGLGGRIGSATTVQEAFDENSGIRVQNGLSWNNAIEVANLLVRAWNLVNLVAISDASQSAGGLAPPPPPPWHGGVCPAGLQGKGTAADPCRGPWCSTTPYGAPPDPNCVARRYVDSAGNILFFLERQQRLLTVQPR